MRSQRGATDPEAVALIEEAVHLLRRASPWAWAIYLVGTVPFVVALLFFWAHTTWFRPSSATVAWGALGLSLLFAVMKTAQAEFCAHLMAQRFGSAPPVWSWRRIARLAVAQLSLQPWALAASGLAAVVVLPFGWVFAYGQIVTVIGDDADLHASAVVEAKRWPAQNHFALLLITGVALCVWANLLTSFFVLPWIANRLLGIDNILGLSGWWILNSTVLASVTALAWLVTDPLIKAFYTLRVFHGRARRSGDDIRVEFSRSRTGTAGMTRVALLLAGVMVLSPHLTAADAAHSTKTAVAPARLNAAIDEVLARSEFEWRLRPLPGEAGDAQAGPLGRFANEGADILRRALHTLRQWLRHVLDWFGGNPPPAQPSPGLGGSMVSAVRALLYVFIGVAVLLLGWLVVLILRQGYRGRAAAVAAQAVAAAVPDLRDEAVHADQLPMDGWLALAQQQIARGEWRLALRALYLATLARLAGEGLIRLAHFKTNLDYERELRRRAVARAEVAGAFSRRRRTFEDVWYGAALPDEADIRGWYAELERPVTQ